LGGGSIISFPGEEGFLGEPLWITTANHLAPTPTPFFFSKKKKGGKKGKRVARERRQLRYYFVGN
jgi:hypothetical protein